MKLYEVSKQNQNISLILLQQNKRNIFCRILPMNRTLQNLVLQELRPDEIWQLSNLMKSILRRQISHLPKSKVTEDETRYPQSPVSMRAFLIKFFARHYLQTQNSLVEYITSQDFYNIIRFGHLRILDVGSGPAVASLAITDMLACLIEHLKYIGIWPRGKRVTIDYILNDTSGICLGTGKRMLTDYYKISQRNNREVVLGQIISIQKGFPDNLNQLQRIMFNLSKYDIATFSYVLSPLNEEKTFKNLVLGLFNVEKLCNYSGRILILQDKFRARLVQRISRAIGISSRKEESTQQVYPKRNTSGIYTYSYYCCLYIPTKKMMIRQNSVA